MHPPEVEKRAVALYESGLSARGVSKRLEKERQTYVSPQTVARWMRELGRSRPAGQPRFVQLDVHAKRNYESGLTIEQVARRYGIGKTSVSKCLREMGVSIRPSGSRFLHFLTKERLQRLFVADGRTVKSIANRAGCSPGTVYRLLKVNRVTKQIDELRLGSSRPSGGQHVHPQAASSARPQPFLPLDSE